MTSEVHRHPNAEPAEPGAEVAESPPSWLAPAQQPHPAPPAPAEQYAPPQQYAPPEQYVPAPQPAAPPPMEGQPASVPHRATGTAHVPEIALLPAHQLPQLPTPVPRVYGRPAGQSPTSPAGPPDAAVAAGYGAAAPGTPFGTASGPNPYQPGPFQPGPGQPAPFQPGPGQPVPFQQPQWPNTPTSGGPYQTVPGEGVPPFGPRPPANPSPASPTPDPYAPPTQSGNSHVGMLIAVGAVVLLAVVGLIWFMAPNSPSGQQFAVDSCVTQSADGGAVPTDCAEAGAYKIVERVQRKEECDDPTQPHVELGSGEEPILCLVPAGAADPASADPSPTAAA